MEIVNEGSAYTITASFLDEDGAAVTPASGRYRIDDQESGTEIKDWTSFTPDGSTHDIEISGADNSLLDTSLAYEHRVLTLELTGSSGKVWTEEFIYAVKNLSFYPSV